MHEVLYPGVTAKVIRRERERLRTTRHLFGKNDWWGGRLHIIYQLLQGLSFTRWFKDSGDQLGAGGDGGYDRFLKKMGALQGNLVRPSIRQGFREQDTGRRRKGAFRWNFLES